MNGIWQIIIDQRKADKIFYKDAWGDQFQHQLNDDIDAPKKFLQLLINCPQRYECNAYGIFEKNIDVCIAVTAFLLFSFDSSFFLVCPIDVFMWLFRVAVCRRDEQVAVSENGWAIDTWINVSEWTRVACEQSFDETPVRKLRRERESVARFLNGNHKHSPMRRSWSRLIKRWQRLMSRMKLWEFHRDKRVYTNNITCDE